MSCRSYSGSHDSDAARRTVATCEIAFRTDPVHVYFTRPAAWSNKAFTESVHGSHVSASFKLERLVGTAQENAVLLWELYPSEKVTTWQILKQGGLLSMLYAVPLFKWAALVKLGAALDDYKAAFEKEHGPFLYIFAIATLPAEQGKGLGSILMRFITARADQLGLASYLEATTEGSKRLYERHGFKSFATYELPQSPSPFTIHIMSRPASTAGISTSAT
ncbi:hypothetical protein WJX84_000863 [Apatococcus fuscideae]